ncbi:MAG: hypothetical protein DRJ99_03105 [Thermoplasmata archaeon]|nr:MAG: hypothetical protein DRJ99_03105 [Thermoplasmata archaeon]
MKEERLFLTGALILLIVYSVVACLLFQTFVFGRTKVSIWFLILIALILTPVIIIGRYYIFAYIKRRKR